MNTATENNPKLTPDQIKNWRDLLASMVGSYAYLASEEEIQKMRDNMQAKIEATRPTP